MSAYEGIVALTWSHILAPFAWDEAQRPLQGALLTIRDQVTGEPITTVTDAVIRAPLNGFLTAEFTMLTDADGSRLAEGAKPCQGEDGNLCTGTFEFLVAEMNTRRPPAGVGDA